MHVSEQYGGARTAVFAAVVLLLGLLLHECAAAAEGGQDRLAFRLRLREAAVVAGETVTLGEIADPIGPMEPGLWAKLAASPLWPAPAEGRPMNITRPKLQQAMAAYAGELSSLCIYPASMTVQRGGAILREDDLRSLVVKTLTPYIRNLPGEAELTDFRLPGSIFLSHAGQRVELEGADTIGAGRNSLRFAVKEMDGVIVRRLTGSVFIDLWSDVPCAASPMNRNDTLMPGQVRFERKNLAYMRDTPWDGKGGPWRVLRPLGIGQPILQSDLAVVPAVKKGATVTMVYEGKNFHLAIPGEALGDAALGESVAVRNLQSKKQVHGVVRDPLTVVVR